MKETEKKSIPEKILDDLFKTLKERDEFDESIMNKLIQLSIANKLSHEKSVEELINPKTSAK